MRRARARAGDFRCRKPVGLCAAWDAGRGTGTWAVAPPILGSRSAAGRVAQTPVPRRANFGGPARVASRPAVRRPRTARLWSRRSPRGSPSVCVGRSHRPEFIRVRRRGERTPAVRAVALLVPSWNATRHATGLVVARDRIGALGRADGPRSPGQGSGTPGRPGRVDHCIGIGRPCVIMSRCIADKTNRCARTIDRLPRHWSMSTCRAKLSYARCRWTWAAIELGSVGGRWTYVRTPFDYRQ
jgi:hypothetical protein